MLNTFLCSPDEAKLLMNGKTNAGYFDCWTRQIKSVRKQQVRKREEGMGIVCSSFHWQTARDKGVREGKLDKASIGFA